MLSELEAIRAGLEGWRRAVALVDEHQRHFRGRMSMFFRVMREAASTPDHAVAIPGEEPESLVGWSYFLTDNLSEQLQSALDQIDAAIAVGRGAEAQLGVRTVKLGDARDRLDAVAHAVRGLRMFFRPDDRMDFPRFVRRVDRAVSGLDRIRYTIEGEDLMDTIAQTSIGLPNRYATLDTEPLRRLRDLWS